MDMKTFKGRILTDLIRRHAIKMDKKVSAVRKEIINGLGLKNKQSLSDYEHDKYAPPSKRQVWLAEYFGVIVEKFYEEVE